jgi:hypothetical protein
MGGRRTYDCVLPGALKGSFATLLSPPQCYATVGKILHTLASVDRSHVCRLRMLTLLIGCRLGLDSGRVYIKQL